MTGFNPEYFARVRADMARNQYAEPEDTERLICEVERLTAACRGGNRGCCVDGTCCACCDRAQRAEERVAAERKQAAAQAAIVERILELCHYHEGLIPPLPVKTSLLIGTIARMRREMTAEVPATPEEPPQPATHEFAPIGPPSSLYPDQACRHQAATGQMCTKKESDPVHQASREATPVDCPRSNDVCDFPDCRCVKANGEAKP